MDNQYRIQACYHTYGDGRTPTITITKKDARATTILNRRGRWNKVAKAGCEVYAVPDGCFLPASCNFFNTTHLGSNARLK